MKTKDRKMSIKMSNDEYAELAAAAEERDVPVSQIVREALRFYLGRD